MRYATVIPLIGGMTLGNKEATGQDPEFFASFDVFAANEEILHNHLPHVPKYDLGTMQYSNFQGLDFISTVCPCAGLSMFNASSSRGANAPQNEWMYKTAGIVLEQLKPRVFFGENAPGLFTKYGEDVAKKLSEIGKKNGYSFSLVKTNTNLHGIPQRRERSFYFFWDSATAPIMNFYKRESKSLIEFLKEIPSDAEGLNPMANYQDDPFCEFMDTKLGKGWRLRYIEDPKELKEFGNGIRFAIEHKDEFYKLLKEKGKENLIKKLEHVQEKLSIGKNYWDFGPTILGKYSEFTSVTSRSMARVMHPIEDRYFNSREMMHLMGLPHNFKLNNYDIDVHKVTQNVPTCTARDQTYEVMKYINGELTESGLEFFKQNNITRTNDKFKHSTKLF